MIDESRVNRERLQELLAAKALGDIVPEEERELDALMTKFPEADFESYELAAAAVDLSFIERRPPTLPQSLQDRILKDAPKHLAQYDDRSGDNPSPAGAVPGGTSSRELFAWFAAAACLLIAAGIWFMRDNGMDAPLAVAEQREQLLAEGADLVQVAWQPGTHPFDQVVEGDVVWSNARQQGFMRFQGMPANDPSERQYQLWIIDAKRDPATPVDGGVFDITGEGEVIVPIDAKLPVFDPAAFAVTVEKPGGMVVSDRDPLPLLAPVQ